MRVQPGSLIRPVLLRLLLGWFLALTCVTTSEFVLFAEGGSKPAGFNASGGGGLSDGSSLPNLFGSYRDSFEGGEYTRLVLDEDTITFRGSDYVPDNQRVGDFFGDSRPLNSLDAEELYNIRKFNNNAWELGVYKLPAGTEVYFGRVANGAGNQFYIPNAQQLLRNGQIELIERSHLFMRFDKALP